MPSLPGQRAYRHTNRWRTTQRRAVLRRDGGICRGCGFAGDDGKGKGLMQAHIVRPEDGGSDEASNIVLLCRTCHAGYDAGQRRRTARR